MTTVRALLEYGVDRFGQAGLAFGHGTDNALDEAAWLIQHALGLPLGDIAPHLDSPVPPEREAAVRALLERRVRTRKPAAYLLNEAWLGPHRFYVDERVIVPRSLIFEWLEAARTGAAGPLPSPQTAGPGFAILDLCTGSGCLAILAALAYPQARIDAADLSEDALAVARRNVADYGLQERVRLVNSDLFAALQGCVYDLILTNPPYVKAASMRRLPAEYRAEPELALASGADGLDHARRILEGARRHLAPAGLLAMEIGHNRKALEKAFPGTAFAWPRTSAGAGLVFTLAREDLPSCVL